MSDKYRFLRLCAHCGGDAVLENFVVDAEVRCTKCGVRVARTHAPTRDTGKDKAVRAWNKRVPT